MPEGAKCNFGASKSTAEWNHSWSIPQHIDHHMNIIDDDDGKGNHPLSI